MGADQVAEIRPALLELEADEKASGFPGKARYFARFSLSSHDTPWVEVYLEEHTIVNLWYPFDGEPLAYLRALGVAALPGLRVEDLVRPSCTLALDRAPTRALARFIDSLFLNMFACGEDYSLDVEVCSFP